MAWPWQSEGATTAPLCGMSKQGDRSRALCIPADSAATPEGSVREGRRAQPRRANTFAIAPHAYKNLRYKIDDFQTVSLTALSPLTLVVNPEVLRVKNFAEFIAYAKANPGKVQCATSGRGVVTHLLGELIAARLGLDMAAVHYKAISA